MGNDARRPLNQEERTRIKAARYFGGACARCGKALSVTEAVWIDHLYVGAGYDFSLDGLAAGAHRMHVSLTYEMIEIPDLHV